MRRMSCVDEINYLFSHTKIKYSTDSTELNMRLIKLIKNELSPLLTFIFIDV